MNIENNRSVPRDDLVGHKLRLRGEVKVLTIFTESLIYLKYVEFNALAPSVVGCNRCHEKGIRNMLYPLSVKCLI